MRGRDVDCGERGGEGGVAGEEGEVEDQENEAVFPAVVGEREGGDAAERLVSRGFTIGFWGKVYSYRSRASWMMARDFCVWACAARSLSVGTSSCKNAVI